MLAVQDIQSLFQPLVPQSAIDYGWPAVYRCYHSAGVLEDQIDSVWMTSNSDCAQF
jgi:hypothetical protein